MALPTAQQAAQKWFDNASNAGTEWYNAMQKITDNPCTKAAAAKQLWLQRIQAAADKWEAKLKAVTLADWKASVTAAGAGAYTQGLNKGKSKYEKFATKFFPYLQQGIAQLPARGTLQQNIQRSNFMINWNAKFNVSQ